MKLITKEIAEKLIPAYQHSADTGESGKDVIVKFFTPWANATWYIIDGMPVTEGGKPIHEDYLKFAVENADKYDWHLFVFCDLGDTTHAELAYVMLSVLKGLKGPAGLKVERDLYYTGAMADVMVKYGRATEDIELEEYNKFEDAEMYPGGAAYNDVMGYNDGPDW